MVGLALHFQAVTHQTKTNQNEIIMENIITLPVPELKTALTGLGKVVSRSTLPVLRTLRIRRDQAGTVSLQGTDLDSFLTYSSLKLLNFFV